MTEGFESLKTTGRRFLFGVQRELRKVVLSFLLGLIVGIATLRSIVWPAFDSVMRSEMSEQLSQKVNIIAQTPFDVFLIQVKIGLFVGLVFIIPAIVFTVQKYHLKNTNADLSKIPKSILALVSIFGLLLFGAGLSYSYTVFFPTVFEFLASVTVQTGFTPTYSIASWTEFMLILSISFGLIAQIPLFLPVLVRYNIIQYKTVKDGWRYWVVTTLALGAVLSPPEPVSQLLWATPLILLYFVSIGISKIVARDDGTPSDDEKGSLNENTTPEAEDTFELQIPEVDEDSEIGGYYSYLQVLLASVKKNILTIGSVFLVTMMVGFYSLYSFITADALSILESSIIKTESFSIIALHPVELLLFQAKAAFILAIITTIPVAIWKVWPEIESEGITCIKRSRAFFYSLLLMSVSILGFVIGFGYLTPDVLNLLVEDASRVDAIISYRINNFFWISIYMSVAIGAMMFIYALTILLSINSQSSDYMISSWKKVVFGIYISAILLTPSGVIKSTLLFIPVCISYLSAVLSLKALRFVYSISLRN